jgi:hypothetical protein
LSPPARQMLDERTRHRLRERARDLTPSLASRVATVAGTSPPVSDETGPNSSPAARAQTVAPARNNGKPTTRNVAKRGELGLGGSSDESDESGISEGAPCDMVEPRSLLAEWCPREVCSSGTPNRVDGHLLSKDSDALFYEAWVGPRPSSLSQRRGIQGASHLRSCLIHSK